MNKIISIILILITFSFITISCDEDEDSYSAPIITMVKKSTISKIDSVGTIFKDTLKSGSLDSWVEIQGDNFVNVTSLKFNDISIDLSYAYITKNVITVQIPRIISKNPNNKITLETKSGMATYDFNVVFPPLQIFGLENEFARGKDTIKIFGKDFDLYELDSNTMISFGDVKVKVLKANRDYLLVKVPKDLGYGLQVSAIDKAGKSYQIPGYYRDIRDYAINTFDYVSGIQWTNTDCIVGPDTNSIANKYFHFKKKIIYDYLIQCNMGVPVPDEVFQNPAKYNFKFEVRTLRPMSKKGFVIEFCGSQYQLMPFKSGSPLDTKGKWQTITIPLDKWPSFDILKKAGFYFYIFGEDLTTEEDIDICLDNFRITPKNN